MFWLWYMDLYSMTFGWRDPCVSCYLYPSQNCEYLEIDWFNGESDCKAPGREDLNTCEDCEYLKCKYCK